MKVIALLLLLWPGMVWADPLAAVGRLQWDGAGSCSAVLVAPDVVLTAGHCLLPIPAGRPIERLSFRLNDGPDGTLTAVDDIAFHPLYDTDNPRTEWLYRFDLAIAKLSAPISRDRAEPIPLGPEARVGERLILASWRLRDAPRPRQRTCPVLQGLKGLVTLGCNVQSGESGAPVLRRSDDGVELVAIVSSRGKILDQPIAQASDVRLRLEPMLQDLLNR